MQPIATHFDFLSKPRAALRFWCEERCVGRNSFGRFCRFANTTFQRFDRYLPRYHVLVFFSSSSLWPSPPPLLPLLDIVFFLLQFDRLTHLRVRVHKRRVSRTQMKEKGKRGGEREGEVRGEYSYIIWLISDTHPHINVRMRIDCEAHTNLVYFYIMHIDDASIASHRVYARPIDRQLHIYKSMGE